MAQSYITYKDPCPCDTDCKWKQDCISSEMECKVFRHWCRTGKLMKRKGLLIERTPDSKVSEDKKDLQDYSYRKQS